MIRPVLRQGISAVAALGIVLLASSCSSSNGGGTSAGGTSGSSKADVSAAQAGVTSYLKAPARILQTVPLPKAPPKGKTLAFLSANNPAAQLAAQGAQQAARAVGWNYFHIIYDPANPGSLGTAFSQALARHVTVVVESGLAQSQFSASTVAAYHKAGVPILVAAAAPVSPTSTILGPVQGSTAFLASATGLADWFVADSRGSGQVLIESVPGFPVLGQFGDAFRARVQKLCPACGIKTIAVSLPDVAAGKLISTVVSTLQSDPKLGYVVFDDGDFAIGITSALKAAGLGRVKVAGQILDSVGAAALRNGSESAWMGWNGYYQGYAAVDMALRWIEKAPLTSNDALSPTQLLTKGNIGSTSEWAEPGDALQQFEKLWKVPATG